MKNFIYHIFIYFNTKSCHKSEKIYNNIFVCFSTKILSIKMKN